jgi:hypothetical protein
MHTNFVLGELILVEKLATSLRITHTKKHQEVTKIGDAKYAKY